MIFLRALLLGFSVAAPVGPIGVLCIRRTLTDGRVTGLACGLGAATADALYGLIAGLGMTALSSVLVQHQMPIRIFGCVYLVVVGVRTFRARPAEEASPVRAGGAIAAWASTFLLTVTNPMTILSFAAMFSAIVAGGRVQAPLLVAGVFLGSAAWWLLLSGGVDRLRTRLLPRHLVWVNRGAGAILLGFALYTILSMR